MSRDNDRRDDVATRLTYLLIGGGIGAILALLFAPKSGQELRGDIADATRKGIDKSREAAAQVGAKAGEYYDGAQKRATEIYSVATDKAGEIAEAAKAAAARQSNTISAAIEAGKRAYTEEKRRTEVSGLTEGGANYYEVEKSS
jgi:gas vesicle protein